MNAKDAFYSVYPKPRGDHLWTGNTLQVYPATLQDFAVGSLLPAVFYMFRTGHRRGAGKFQAQFGQPAADTVRAARATVRLITWKLSSQTDGFEGFGSSSSVADDILGDLLLCDSLENKRRSEGHDQEVMRVFPVHFFASWVDLPKAVGDLRFVPEMLVALLANLPGSTNLKGAKGGDFPVAVRPSENLLLRIFGGGAVFGENATLLAGQGVDAPNEAYEFSIQQWLMVRIAQTCGQAPEKVMGNQRGSADIPNLWPLATHAAHIFREDLQALLRFFGKAIPQRALTPMLESFIGLGLWHSFFASLLATTKWEKSGIVPIQSDQEAFPFFVDSSNGTDGVLRDISENSMYGALCFLDAAVISLAVVRVLDVEGRSYAELENHVPGGSDQVAWLNLLGQVRMGGHEESPFFHRMLRNKVTQLRDRLTEAEIAPDAVVILQGKAASKDPARAIAEALCAMMGEKKLKAKYLQFIDSAAMFAEPHGFVKKRSISRKLSTGKARRMDARSIVLPNTLLETLVHVHLATRKGRLSFSDFLALLRTRYGLWVDEAPPGITAAREDLQRNRAVLERRLRDLGLLVGVNDAESMKRLRARYRSTPIAE
jgi:hypothetical protein